MTANYKLLENNPDVDQNDIKNIKNLVEIAITFFERRLSVFIIYLKNYIYFILYK